MNGKKYKREVEQEGDNLWRNNERKGKKQRNKGKLVEMNTGRERKEKKCFLIGMRKSTRKGDKNENIE